MSTLADARREWERVLAFERSKERIEELARALFDVEGSLLAYSTDIPASEIKRLMTLIRSALGDYEPRAANSQERPS